MTGQRETWFTNISGDNICRLNNYDVLITGIELQIVKLRNKNMKVHQ